MTMSRQLFGVDTVMNDAILDRYDDLFSKIKPNGPRFQALYWEQTGLEIIFSILKSLKIPFSCKPEDIRPLVRTVDGKEVEIDFRVEIENSPVYFGVTAFSDRDSDLRKDVVETNIPVHDLKRETFVDGQIVHTEHVGEGVLLSRRTQTDYLNRRIAVRIATEGRNPFPSDYIYIFFPLAPPGSADDIGGIPARFTFESKYFFQQNAIRGIMLVGQYVGTRADGSMNVQKYKWAVRANPMPGCSPMMERLLRRLDGMTLDLRERLKSMRAILEAKQTDPEVKTYLEVFRRKYADLT
jgi:hypothetical protein